MRHRLAYLGVLAVAMASGGLLVGSPQARAATSCPLDIIGTTVGGNVVVPANQSCKISNSTVTGSVTVNPGASIFIEGSTIQGSVDATKAAKVTIDALVPCTPVCARAVLIQGNVTVDGTTGGPNVICTGTQINGTLKISNSGPAAEWRIGNPTNCSPPGLVVGGNVRFTGNAGKIQLENGRVGGSVTASGNTGAGSDIKNETIPQGSLTTENNNPCWLLSGNSAGRTNAQPCP